MKRKHQGRASGNMQVSPTTVLFPKADDYHAGALSCPRQSDVKTPDLGGLAMRGTRDLQPHRRRARAVFEAARRAVNARRQPASRFRPHPQRGTRNPAALHCQNPGRSEKQACSGCVQHPCRTDRAAGRRVRGAYAGRRRCRLRLARSVRGVNTGRPEAARPPKNPEYPSCILARSKSGLPCFSRYLPR